MEKIEKILNYEYKNKELLTLALTHSSAKTHNNKNINSYERLEFLGDRVLGLCVAELIYNKYNNENEGELAIRQSKLISEAALSKIAQNLGLGDYIIFGFSELKEGGKYKSSVLCDVVEALIGSMYLDGGLNVVQEFVKKNWDNLIISDITPPKDNKMELQEWLLKKQKIVPKYNLISKIGEEHSPLFEVEVVINGVPSQKGQGTSKKKAEQDAASNMIKHLKNKGLM